MAPPLPPSDRAGPEVQSDLASPPACIRPGSTRSPKRLPGSLPPQPPGRCPVYSACPWSGHRSVDVLLEEPYKRPYNVCFADTSRRPERKGGFSEAWTDWTDFH